MKPKRSHFSAFAPATAVLMALSLSSVPSAPSASELLTPVPQAVSPEADLAHGGPGSGLSGTVGHEDTGFHGLSTSDLAAAIRSEPRSLELFDRARGAEAARRFLEHVPYGDRIFRTAGRYKLDSLLLAALVETESRFDPAAVSPQGAVGLTQVMPETAEDFGSHDLLDPAANLDAGARYFSTLLERFGGDPELALAAYNAGPATVSRYGGVPPFPETRRYVEKVMSLYYDHQARVGRRWPTSGPREAAQREGSVLR